MRKKERNREWIGRMVMIRTKKNEKREEKRRKEKK